MIPIRHKEMPIRFMNIPRVHRETAERSDAALDLLAVLCRQTHSLIRYCLAGRLNATKEGLNSCSGEVLVRRSSQRTHKCCAANSPSRSGTYGR